jgi:hypothetical protein
VPTRHHHWFARPRSAQRGYATASLCRSALPTPNLERTTAHGSLTSSAGRGARDARENSLRQPSDGVVVVSVSGGFHTPLLPRLRRPPRPIKETPRRYGARPATVVKGIWCIITPGMATRLGSDRRCRATVLAVSAGGFRLLGESVAGLWSSGISALRTGCCRGSGLDAVPLPDRRPVRHAAVGNKAVRPRWRIFETDVSSVQCFNRPLAEARPADAWFTAHTRRPTADATSNPRSSRGLQGAGTRTGAVEVSARYSITPMVWRAGGGITTI